MPSRRSRAGRLADGQRLRSSQLDQLNRQAELARDKFLQYSRNMEEAFIDVALESQKINNVSVVQPATLAEKPVSPSKAMVALATLVLAVAGTGALVLLSERPSQNLYGDEDYEPTNGTVNGAATNGAVHAEPSPVRRSRKLRTDATQLPRLSSRGFNDYVRPPATSPQRPDRDIDSSAPTSTPTGLIRHLELRR